MRVLFLLMVVLFVGVPLTLINGAPLPAGKDELIENYEWKGQTRKRTVRTVSLGGQKVEFVKIPAGEFMMGSGKNDPCAYEQERPQHKVTFTKAVWIAKYPVTKGQFSAFVDEEKYITELEKIEEPIDPTDQIDEKFTWKKTGWHQSDRHPVVYVSWNDALAYCKWASKQTANKIRLLSEAEYEYAQRGGSGNPYSTGDEPDSLEGYGNFRDASRKLEVNDATFFLLNAANRGLFDCFKFDDGEKFTSKVGKYKPNGYGLYDMTGNVENWCADYYDREIYTKRKDGVTDPTPCLYGDSKYRSIRGASWDTCPNLCRCAYRSGSEINEASKSVGFRLALE